MTSPLIGRDGSPLPSAGRDGSPLPSAGRDGSTPDRHRLRRLALRARGIPLPSAGVTTKLLKQTIAFPSRKTLPHTPPVSVSQYAKDAYYFLTICVDRNHYNIDGNCISKTGPLCGATAVRILCHLAHYRAQKNISPTYALVMPDHIHLIAKASECTSISNFIERYKHFTARDCGITWQKGYFDHRLRSEKEVEEKTLYIAMNPVRQGLVENIEQWPYRMEWK